MKKEGVRWRRRGGLGEVDCLTPFILNGVGWFWYWAKERWSGLVWFMDCSNKVDDWALIVG